MTQRQRVGGAVFFFFRLLSRGGKEEVEAVVGPGGGRAQCSFWESWSSDNRAGSVTPSPESRRKSSSVHSVRPQQQKERDMGTRALVMFVWWSSKTSVLHILLNQLIT